MKLVHMSGRTKKKSESYNVAKEFNSQVLKLETDLLGNDVVGQQKNDLASE